MSSDVVQYKPGYWYYYDGMVPITTCVCVCAGGESGSADTARDPRGFAVKFYTEEGNWDLVGNNTPIFFIRDPTHVCFMQGFSVAPNLLFSLVS